MDSPHEYRKALRLYRLGLALALLLTVIPTALVQWAPWSRGWVLASVLLLALAQIVVHFRCFLHISLAKPHRHDLHLVLFSTLIIVLMVGGSLVVFFDQQGRM